MNDLLKRVEDIRDACVDPKKKKQQEDEDKKLDDFMRLKKKIANEVREIRKVIFTQYKSVFFLFKFSF